MPLPLVSQVLKEVSSKRLKKDKIVHLRYHRQNPVMIEFFKYVYDPNIKFALPEGDPPYKPSEFLDDTGGLYRNLRKMYIFIQGRSQNIPQVKRESIFIEVLESIHPEEAKLLLAVKDKKIPYPGIDEKLIKEAFPNLL